MKEILILSDNLYLFPAVISICREKLLSNISFGCSSPTTPSVLKYVKDNNLLEINVKNNYHQLIDKYSLIISMHCKQIFPSDLVNNVRCINFHPGYNPYNRGFFPHVFSMINGLPAGITIHEIDEQIDHGPIIYQERIFINEFETSKNVYDRILAREVELFSEYIEKIIDGNYSTIVPTEEGNYNSLKSFENLKEIKLDKIYSGQELINLLRALSFPGYRNAFFIAEDSNEKCYITLDFDVEEEDDNA
jgi:methionyl-tRNA formyltransferase